MTPLTPVPASHKFDGIINDAITFLRSRYSKFGQVTTLVPALVLHDVNAINGPVAFLR